MRHVANFEVLGAYLHEETPKGERILMKLRGDFVDIMCQVKPEYKQHICYENGKKVMYLLFPRVIYGCIESTLLRYKLSSTTLEKMRFEINPYEIYVANKMI